MTDTERPTGHEAAAKPTPVVSRTPPAAPAASPAASGGPPVAVFVVAFLAAFAAAGTAFALGGLLGLGVGVAIGFAGAAVTTMLSAQAAQAQAAKASALLGAATAEHARSEPPASFREEPWASLYRHVAETASSKRTASLAVLEVERLRKTRDGASFDPLANVAPVSASLDTEAPSLESVSFEAAPIESESFEPRPSYASDDLVGAEPLAPAIDAPAPVDPAVVIAEAVGPYREAVASIESDLAAVLDALRQPSGATAGGAGVNPAQLVDTLVRTAADGIEDLAAGLMRANELAGVAERVTNRATLLALNAALEATRSGSEAFASIAEETRRLAEYAREATDTISRLSGEIEMKVGETIAAIQSTSEDAKAAVASMESGGAPQAPVVSAGTADAVQALLARTRSLRERLDAAAGTAGAPGMGVATVAAETPDAEPGPAEAATDAEPVADAPSAGEDPDAEPAPMTVTLDASDEHPADFGDVGPLGVRAAGASDHAPKAPPIEPKIPDWLQGIRPDGPQSS
ncbi:MAG TPA: methyl-accepting chemotaxis protein [Acidobacteriota bacterium]|nr:methyl-accepting chemotaxis protein [Acidobacteriota bacterium]